VAYDPLMKTTILLLVSDPVVRAVLRKHSSMKGIRSLLPATWDCGRQLKECAPIY